MCERIFDAGAIRLDADYYSSIITGGNFAIIATEPSRRDERIQIHGNSSPNSVSSCNVDELLTLMFLLFTASNAGGAILDENDSGTLDRVLASRVSMPSLLFGKLLFLASLAFTQLVVMFVKGEVAFQLDLWHHLAGFVKFGLIAFNTWAIDDSRKCSGGNRRCSTCGRKWACRWDVRWSSSSSAGIWLGAGRWCRKS
jgi:hypothetical protein